MRKSELRQLIREELLKERGQSFWEAWGDRREAESIYNFCASTDVLSSNLNHFMDELQAGKIDDAKFSLKVVLDEIVDVKKDIKKIETLLKNKSGDL